MKHLRFIFSFVFVFLILFPIDTIAKSGPTVCVAVLENVDPQNWGSKISFPCPRVRVAFGKAGTEWAALSKPPASKMNWSVFYRGQKIGTAQSKKVNVSGHPGWVGLQKVTLSKGILRPKAGKDQRAYFEGQNIIRPLMLTTLDKPYDSENWKESKLTPVEKALAIKAFRTKFPKLERCATSGEPPAKMVPYTDKQLLFLMIYRSNKNELVYGIQFDPQNNTCQNNDDENFKDQWYVMDAKRNIRSIGSVLNPIGMADLDGDGQTEWVFYHFEGEQRESYILFYDDFAKLVNFGWSYR